MGIGSEGFEEVSRDAIPLIAMRKKARCFQSIPASEKSAKRKDAKDGAKSYPSDELHVRLSRNHSEGVTTKHESHENQRKTAR